MQIKILPDPTSVASASAALVAERVLQSVAERGRFTIALSGGSTPWAMLAEIAKEDLPWDKVHVFQVDERVAPTGDKDRNLTHMYASLLDSTPIPPGQIYPMPVEDADLDEGCRRYAVTLSRIVGNPTVIDLIHLGLGPDGHTASLIPEDKSLDVTDMDVASAGPYQERMRMTLTYPIINRAREIMWLLTGSGKTEMLNRMKAGDKSIPAGRVSQENAIVFADQAAAG